MTVEAHLQRDHGGNFYYLLWCDKACIGYIDVEMHGEVYVLYLSFNRGERYDHYRTLAEATMAAAKAYADYCEYLAEGGRD